MNALCATGSGMSGLTSGVINNNNKIPEPTGLTANNSISIPLDSDPDLVLHYPLNSDILNYVGSNPTTGINDASFSGIITNIGLTSNQSIFPGGQSLNKLEASNADNFLKIDNYNTLFVANTGGYSFSCWIYIQGATSERTFGMIWSICRDRLLFNTINNNQNKYGMYYSNGAQGLQILAVPAGPTAALAVKTFLANPVLNIWYHIVWTLNTSSQSNVYVNGTRVLTNDTTIPYFSVAMNDKYLLGDTNISSTMYGYMNDFRYYNRILDISEVKQLYNIYSFYLNNDPTLVLYYPFDNNFLNYASGIGSTYNTIVTTGVSINKNRFKVGKGSYNNSSAAVPGILNSIIANTGGYTIAFWFYITSLANVQFLNMATGSSGTSKRIFISLLSGTMKIFSYNRSGKSQNVFNPSTSTWYHFVWTLNTSSVSIIYINGVYNNTYSSVDYINNVFNNNNYFGFISTGNINIDDFRYYNRVLNQTDITNLYNYNNSISSPLNLNSDPSLCLYYTFDISTNTVSNYAQNVYGTVDATYNNGASANYTDLSYVGTAGLKLLGTNNGYVQLLPTSVVNTTNFISNSGMTFACWFYSKSSLSNAKIFDFNDTYDSYNNNIFVSMNASSSISTNVYTSPTTSSTVSLATNYNNSILYHFVWTMTYSNSQTSSWNIYINATNVSTTTLKYYPNQVARGSDFLGKSNISSDPSFNGYIDDFRVYQRVLTQAEINQLFSYNNTLNVKSTNFSWTKPNTTKTPLTYNYFYKDNSLNITPNILSYFSGLSWTAFYGVINDYTSIATTTTSNSFQTISQYSGGSNTKTSSASNALTNINYPNTTIASTNNIFGFDNTNGNGDNGYFISLVITGYFKSNLTGIWNFQFAAAGSQNDDFSIFWINDGANVNGTINHWPPTDTNYNNLSSTTFIYSTTLTADVYYPIQITWSQAGGGSILGFQFQPPGGSYTTDGSGYFFSQSSTPVNTSSTNSVINNLIEGNGITYSVNAQVDTKQSKYVSVTK
jgi:hypothetical protein